MIGYVKNIYIAYLSKSITGRTAHFIALVSEAEAITKIKLMRSGAEVSSLGSYPKGRSVQFLPPL